MKEKFFVVPKNDLESVEIIKMLEKAGYKQGENLFVTEQKWGASWDGLEPHIKEALTNLPAENVYGVELKGKSPYNNIDHHFYSDRNWETGEIVYSEDRTRKEGSIEQVALLIGVPLNEKQLFVAANDKGFVEAMKELGEKLGYSEEATVKMIKAIRAEEHAIIAESQGITPEQEAQAVEAIERAEKLENGTLVVYLPHSKCTTVTDRIPMQEYEGGLLIVCGDGEVDYYGLSENTKKLMDKFDGWTSDQSMKYGFYGTTNGSLTADILKMVEEFPKDEKGEQGQGVLSEDTNTKNNEIKDLKEQFTKVNHIFLHQDEPQFSDVDWDSVTKEFFLLKTRMEEVIKTLSSDEFYDLVEKDFQDCVRSKTAEPLLWMCGIDVSELHIHGDMWMDYAPDVDIGLVTRPNEADRDVLCFSVRTYGLAVHWDFDLWGMEESLHDMLKTAEAYKEAYLDENKEDLTDEELEDEDYEL